MPDNDGLAVTEQPNDLKTTVVVVEDDVLIGQLLVQTLTEETPYKAMLFTNGMQVLEAVKTLKPGAFVLDYHLPGIKGLELYDRLSAIPELGTPPAIVISAGSVPLRELRNREITFLSKPFDLDDFLAAVEKVLRQTSSGSSLRH